jgi:hypothetical protein
MFSRAVNGILNPIFDGIFNLGEEIKHEFHKSLDFSKGR